MPKGLFSPPVIWILLGFAFAAVELVIPGFILIFFAIGAWVTAAVTFFVPLAFGWQLAVFIAASLLTLLTLRKYMAKAFRGDTADEGSDVIEQADTGKLAMVTKDITPTVPGEIKYRGSFWKAAAQTDITAGQNVRITGRSTEDPQAFNVEQV